MVGRLGSVAWVEVLCMEGALGAPRVLTLYSSNHKANIGLGRTVPPTAPCAGRGRG